MMETELVSKLLRRVSSEQETVFDISEKNGVRRVEVVRRKALPETRREDLPLARAQARAHVFHDIDTFSDYCCRECEDGESVGLADVDSETITVVLDESKDRGRESVSFAAKIHPLFKPWLDLLGKPIPVIDFSIFAQKYRRSIKKPDGREVALMFSQIKLAKAVEINRGVGKRALNGIMVHTEISGSKQDALLELPEEIHLHCPVYIGAEPQDIVLDVLVTEGREDQVVVYLTSPEIEAVRIKAFESFVEYLQGNCEHIIIGLGKIESKKWETVPQF
ncbi:DUF2303 family protein [Pirellulaceae bacterium SH449]